MFLFDIIIPTYNNYEELKNCLVAFEHQTIKNFRVFVCIDGSTDETLSFLQDYTYKASYSIRILQHADCQNHGRNATRNLSLPFVESEFLIFCDSDCVPRKDFLQQHHSILKQNNTVSIGDIIYQNANTNLWAAYLHTRGKRKYKNGQEIPFTYITTGNLGLPTRFFTSIGGQDATMKSYGGGDTEFAYRLHKKFSCKPIYNASAISDSVMGKTIPFALDQMESFGQHNFVYIRKKHPEFTSIYKAHLLTKSSLKARLFQCGLHPFLGIISETLCSILPISFATFFVGHAVGSRILKGYKKSTL